MHKILLSFAISLSTLSLTAQVPGISATNNNFNTIKYLKPNNLIDFSVFQKVIPIKYNGKYASSFILQLNNTDHIITAKHLFPKTLKSNSVIEIETLSDTGWVKFDAIILFHENPNIDIAVLNLTTHRFHNDLLRMDPSFAISQECYFLGYPFGMISEAPSKAFNDGFPIPFVKKAIISAAKDSFLGNVLYLDGHNNPGFSGGPVVIIDLDSDLNSHYKVIGVVSGYVNDDKDFQTPFGKLIYSENSGIILVYSAKHISEIVNKK